MRRSRASLLRRARVACAQVFAGGGCVITTGGAYQQCACRHLTDFSVKPTRVANATFIPAAPSGAAGLQQRRHGKWWLLVALLSCALSAVV
jgi:hypothetical protein